MHVVVLATLYGFNGAATLSLRRHDNLKLRTLAEIRASMGPQLYRCGDRGNPSGLPDFVFTASMGPQLYRCGDLARISTPTHIIQTASMGPQLYRCGDEDN